MRLGRWTRAHLDVVGLTCPKRIVNDAEIAHWGTFESGPGILAVSGTGSMVFAITDSGKRIRDYDLFYYARSSARYLGFGAVYDIMRGQTSERDQSLIDAILDMLGLQEVSDLTGFVEKCPSADHKTINRLMGSIAPVISRYADGGTPLARRVCENIVEQITTSIELLAVSFDSPTVSYALVGGVARSQAIRTGIATRLAQSSKRCGFQEIQPVYSPVGSAVFEALCSLDEPPNNEAIKRMLMNIPQARFPTG